MKSVGSLVIILAVLLSVSPVQADNLSESEIESDTSLPQSQRRMPFEDLDNTELDRPTFRGDSVFLDSFIQYACSTYHIPGLATYIVKDGQCVWNCVYGYANLDDSIEVADTTLFQLESISKTFTGTALMQLWERGLFDLHDNINDYLPITVTNPFFPDSVITFWNLLTHSSGIKDNWDVLDSTYFWGGDNPIGLGEFLANYLTPGGVYHDSANNFYTWPPGAQYEYCNVGVALVGCLVEALIGDSFPVYCQDSIFTPLSMNETSWFFANLDTNNIAIGYRWYGGSYHPYPYSSAAYYPAANLRTSSIQLARFLTAFMQYGEIDSVRILDSTTVDLMITPQGPSCLTYPPFQDSIGLVWFFGHDGPRWLWGHAGGGWGYTCVMAFCTEENTGVIALSNIYPYDCGPGLYLIMHELFEYAAQLGIVEAEDYSPSYCGFSLCQTYPNPFNRSTTIRFVLPRYAHVKLKVHNILGQEVAALVDDELGVGEYSVFFDAERLPTGVYFIKFMAGDYSATGKALLIR